MAPPYTSQYIFLPAFSMGFSPSSAKNQELFFCLWAAFFKFLIHGKSPNFCLTQHKEKKHLEVFAAGRVCEQLQLWRASSAAVSRAPSQLWPHLPPHTCGFCCLKEVLISLCPAVCPHLGAAAPAARPGPLQVLDLTWASSTGARGCCDPRKCPSGQRGCSWQMVPVHLGPSLCHEGLQPSRTEMGGTAVRGQCCRVWTAGSTHGPLLSPSLPLSINLLPFPPFIPLFILLSFFWFCF